MARRYLRAAYAHVESDCTRVTVGACLTRLFAWKARHDIVRGHRPFRTFVSLYPEAWEVGSDRRYSKCPDTHDASLATYFTRRTFVRDIHRHSSTKGTQKLVTGNSPRPFPCSFRLPPSVQVYQSHRSHDPHIGCHTVALGPQCVPLLHQIRCDLGGGKQRDTGIPVIRRRIIGQIVARKRKHACSLIVRHFHLGRRELVSRPHESMVFASVLNLRS